MATDRGVRRRLAVAIQKEHDSSDETEGAVLVGFVVIAEWASPDGGRWLTRSDGDGTGELGLPDWHLQGYLHNALHTEWDEDETGDSNGD